MTDVRPAEHANELSKIDKTRFCVAFFVFSFAWMLALQIVAAVLLPQRLADIAPDSKDAIFGVLNSATALASLISNLVVGNMSDRTRARSSDVVRHGSHRAALLRAFRCSSSAFCRTV